MMKRLLLFSALTISLLGVGVGTVRAVDVLDGPCTDATKDSPVCRDKESQRVQDANGEQQNPLFGKDGIITVIINLLSAVAGIIAVIVIILAGLKFVTSGSNPQDANSAREMIIYAAVGLIIAASAQLIVRLFLFKIGD